MANPTGHTYHHGEHKPFQGQGGPGIVYRQGEPPGGGRMQSPRKLSRPDWYWRFPRVAQRLENAGDLVQRYPWGFFVVGLVAGGLIGCYGRKML